MSEPHLLCCGDAWVLDSSLGSYWQQGTQLWWWGFEENVLGAVVADQAAIEVGIMSRILLRCMSDRAPGCSLRSWWKLLPSFGS